MEPAPQELLKEYVNSQKFSSTADIMQPMKEMFRDFRPKISYKSERGGICRRSDLSKY